MVAGVGILISAASPSDARAAVSAPALAGQIAEPWPQRQAAAGSFADYMAPRGARSRDLYGHAMLGYGLLATGLQRYDRRLVDSGLRGLVYAVDHPRPFHSVVFEKLALAAGYNLARARTASNPLFAGARSRWQARLRAMRPTWLGRAREPVLQPAPGGRRDRARAGAQRRALARRDGRGAGGRPREPAAAAACCAGTTNGGTTMAADGALSYHALTVGFYARAIKLLGGRRLARGAGRCSTGWRARRGRWRRPTATSATSAAPRSRPGRWRSPPTARMPRPWRGRARGRRATGPSPSRRSAGCATLHVGGPDGLYLTPAFREDRAAAIAAQEDYVSGSAYTGFTLLGLAWVGERSARRARWGSWAPTRAPPGAWTAGGGSSRCAPPGRCGWPRGGGARRWS